MLSWWHSLILCRLLARMSCRGRSIYSRLLCSFCICDEERNEAVWEFLFFSVAFTICTWCEVHTACFLSVVVMLCSWDSLQQRVKTFANYLHYVSWKSSVLWYCSATSSLVGTIFQEPSRNNGIFSKYNQLLKCKSFLPYCSNVHSSVVI